MTTTQQTHPHPSASPEAHVLAELVGTSKQFGTGSAAVQAVRGLDLEVRSGELSCAPSTRPPWPWRSARP